MPVRTATMRQALAAEYAARATHGQIYSTVPGATAGTTIDEAALTWGAPTDDGTVATVTATATLDVPAGTTVRGAGVHDGPAGAYLDGDPVDEQPYATAGTYEVTFRYTQA